MKSLVWYSVSSSAQYQNHSGELMCRLAYKAALCAAGLKFVSIIPSPQVGCDVGVERLLITLVADDM